MDKKVKIKIVIVCIFLFCLVALIIKINYGKKIVVRKFLLSDYISNTVDFKSDIKLGNIRDKYDVLTNTERLWKNSFGLDVEKEKPYQIFFDKNERVWLVTGSLPPNWDGGVAHILIREKDGKVLALWHEK
jgi:hypothetical protein